MSREVEILNAIVKSTFIGIEDHGIPTFNIGLQIGDATYQGFGQRDLRFFGVRPLIQIPRVLEAASWERLPGTHCRVRRGPSGDIEAVGHFLKESWYEPAADHAAHGVAP